MAGALLKYNILVNKADVNLPLLLLLRREGLDNQDLLFALFTCIISLVVSRKHYLHLDNLITLR